MSNVTQLVKSKNARPKLFVGSGMPKREINWFNWLVGTPAMSEEKNLNRAKLFLQGVQKRAQAAMSTQKRAA